MNDFNPGQLTVLIGPNGAGKSNFISFFRMLSWTFGSPGNLQGYVGEHGGASALLHDGPGKTREIESDIKILTDSGEDQYYFRIAFAAKDTFIFADEKYRFLPANKPDWGWRQMLAGHRESMLIEKAAAEDKNARFILNLLRKIIVYQFHNTSATARMRSKWDIEDNRWLKEDAGNIAPFLMRLRQYENKNYQIIVETIRQILPFFADFEFESDYGRLLLCWREKNSDRVFNASQAADGMLRVMALVTLLLQPEKDLPDVLIIDEPELGLHPYAINILGGIIKAVARKIQVIIATQSVALLDCFEPEDIVVVERKQRETTFKRLEESHLKNWLADYSLSDLWEKNVIGGRP